MAIYRNLTNIEVQLIDIYHNLSKHPDDQENDWNDGYMTAMDVATCANEDTEWHTSDFPMDTEVLVCYDVDGKRHMSIGHWDDNGWTIYNCLYYDEVIAWMELPDVPTFEGRANPDEGDETERG